jgi:(S)-2-hydroxyglutarate dehydrogenase
MTDQRYDIVVIGGGIVGLSVAMEITRRFPRLRMLLVEKEDGVARHQTGHNSGVIHSGIYYKPGSLKAAACVAGARAMIAFCQEHGIPCQVCGKLIVATSQEELPRLEELRQRGLANGLSGLRLIERAELAEIEPHCGGLRALHVPSTGITDFSAVAAKYAELTRNQGGEIRTNCRVTALPQRNGELVIETTQGGFATRHAINCAGLHSDTISRMAGTAPAVRIVPFRGEYYEVRPESVHLVRGLIYPVPDPRFPFLGVHFTRRVSGGLEAGPNAVLAFKREGYRKMDFSLGDTLNELTYAGFWRMAAKYWRSGMAEVYRSFSKKVFVRALQKLVPEIRSSDLAPGGSGVRAQALARDGSLVDDFRFECSGNMLHVFNVPSPAATASLPVGQAIVRMAEENFRLAGG